MSSPWIDPDRDYDTLTADVAAEAVRRRARARLKARILGSAAVVLLLAGTTFAVTGRDSSSDVATTGPDRTSTTSTTVDGDGDEPQSTTTSVADAGTGSTTPGGATGASTTLVPAIEPIRVGNVGTYSGPLASGFQPGRDLLETWVSQVNARGGVAGHIIELTTRDDGGDAARHQQMVRELVEQVGVVSFVGNLSLVSGSAADYLASAGVPVIGGDGLSSPWGASPSLYPVGPALRDQAAGVMELASANGMKNVDIFYCSDYSYCSESGEAANSSAATFGMTVGKRVGISPMQPDLPCSSNQAIVIFADAFTLNRLAAKCPKPLVTGALAVLTGSVPVGTRAVLPTLPWTNTSGSAAGYKQLAASKAGLRQGYATAVAFAAVRMLEQSATKGTWGPAVSAEQISAGLAGIQGDTLGGFVAALTFGGKRGPSCAFPSQFINGDWQSTSSEPRCW
jgi:branched-chain amino acid transport system substrate-binding protein